MTVRGDAAVAEHTKVPGRDAAPSQRAESPESIRRPDPLEATTVGRFAAAPPGSPSADVPAPYRGLESYRETDAAYFFGREVLVARLAALVTSTTSTGPTILVGAGGSGKSSALQAGVAARLRSAGNWEVITLTPGNAPMAALDEA